MHPFPFCHSECHPIYDQRAPTYAPEELLINNIPVGLNKRRGKPKDNEHKVSLHLRKARATFEIDTKLPV